MIEDVLNKLDNNEYCELDINELRILYEIDEVSNISLKLLSDLSIYPSVVEATS